MKPETAAVLKEAHAYIKRTGRNADPATLLALLSALEYSIDASQVFKEPTPALEEDERAVRLRLLRTYEGDIKAEFSALAAFDRILEKAKR